MARKRSRFFPDTPTIFELVKLTPDQEWLFGVSLDRLNNALKEAVES